MNVPAYRQITYWNQLGLAITRENISNWRNLVGHEYLSLLVERFQKQLWKEDVAYADETTYRVLNSNKESTVFWVFSNMSDSSTPLVISHHNETRKTAVSKDFLKEFTGYLHCDGYSVYRSLDGILPVHMRDENSTKPSQKQRQPIDGYKKTEKKEFSSVFQAALKSNDYWKFQHNSS